MNNNFIDRIKCLDVEAIKLTTIWDAYQLLKPYSYEKVWTNSIAAA